MLYFWRRKSTHGVDANVNINSYWRGVSHGEVWGTGERILSLGTSDKAPGRTMAAEARAGLWSAFLALLGKWEHSCNFHFEGQDGTMGKNTGPGGRPCQLGGPALSLLVVWPCINCQSSPSFGFFSGEPGALVVAFLRGIESMHGEHFTRWQACGEFSKCLIL